MAEVLATFGDPFLMARLETLLREDRTREPYYFWAALTLGDPILLPAVRDAAGQWAARMKEDPAVRDAITWVIEALEEACSVPRAERGDL